jgi:hypothetical protein
VLLEFALSGAWIMVGGVGRRRAVVLRHDLDLAGQIWAEEAGVDDYKPVGSGEGVVLVGVLAPIALFVGWGVLFGVLLAVG